MNDIIDLELYRKDYEALHAKLDELTVEESAAPSRPPDAGRLWEVFFEGWQEMYGQLSREDRQAFWRVGIERIVVGEDRRIRVTFRG